MHIEESTPRKTGGLTAHFPCVFRLRRRIASSMTAVPPLTTRPFWGRGTAVTGMDNGRVPSLNQTEPALDERQGLTNKYVKLWPV